MRGGLLRVLALRTAVALGALACSEPSDPVALPTVRPAEQSQLFAEQAPISHVEIGAAPEPGRADASPRSPEPAPTSIPEGSRPLHSTAVAMREAVAAFPAPESHLPLDVLLRTPLEPGPPKSPLILGEPGEAPVAAAPPASGLDGWKDRVRIERYSEPYGVPGPRQGTVSQTEAGVRIPVDDSISVNGGVRVDQRDEPGVHQPERVSRPQVGVEIKF